MASSVLTEIRQEIRCLSDARSTVDQKTSISAILVRLELFISENPYFYENEANTTDVLKLLEDELKGNCNLKTILRTAVEFEHVESLLKSESVKVNVFTLSILATTCSYDQQDWQVVDDKPDVASLELFRKVLPYVDFILKRLSSVKNGPETILSFWRSLAIFAEKDENKELLVRQSKVLEYIPRFLRLEYGSEIRSTILELLWGLGFLEKNRDLIRKNSEIAIKLLDLEGGNDQKISTLAKNVTWQLDSNKSQSDSTLGGGGGKRRKKSNWLLIYFGSISVLVMSVVLFLLFSASSFTSSEKNVTSNARVSLISTPAQQKIKREEKGTVLEKITTAKFSDAVVKPKIGRKLPGLVKKPPVEFVDQVETKIGRKLPGLVKKPPVEFVDQVEKPKTGLKKPKPNLADYQNQGEQEAQSTFATDIHKWFFFCLVSLLLHAFIGVAFKVIGSRRRRNLQQRSTQVQGQNQAQSQANDDKDSSQHVMISYCWAQQPVALKLRDRLREMGVAVWLDVERMEGSLLQRMAEAVENSYAVIVCVSHEYSKSQACRSEAEYSYTRKKTVVPVIVQQGPLPPSGWLPLLIAGKLYYNVYDDNKLREEFPRLHSYIQKLQTGKMHSQ